jgi:hypothetical protein
MSQSIQYLVEDAVAGLLGGISGLNVYTANRTGSRLFPYATVQTSINSQLLGNFTGVYDLNVAVNYSDTAVKTTQEDFDSEYCQIFEAFYSETPTLKSKIQAELDVIGGTCYMARIVSQSPTIRTNKRAWQRGLTLNIFATPQPEVAPAPTYIAALQFNDHRNSQYIGAI